MSAATPRAASARAVPGPIAATVAPASARASRPAASIASNSSRTPLGLVRQISSYSRDRGDRLAHLRRVEARLDPDRRQLDRLGAEAAERRGEPARLGAGAGDDHAPAVERAALEPGERLAPFDHGADHDQRRGADPLAPHRLGQRGERRGDGPLARHRAALDRRRGLLGVAPGLDQRRGVLGQPLDAHVEDEGAREGGERPPVERRLGLLGVLVAGHEGDRGGVVAVGDRDPGVGGGGDAGGHAGHDLELDPGLAQRLALLAAAAEDEGVAALEPDDALARAGGGDQPLADLLLRHRRHPGRLADVDELGVLAGAVERPRRDQPVVEDRVGAGDQLQRARRHQPRVAGPRADQVDDPRPRPLIPLCLLAA